jgi:Insect cuticle protein
LHNNCSYNAFNKQQQQFHNVPSQVSHYQNYQHQTHHNQFNQQQQQPQPQQQQQQHRYQPQTAYQAPRNFIPITSFKSDVSHDGSYQYSYSTGNGIKADESGFLKHLGANKAQVVQGSYSYTSPEGIPIHVQYTADEYGFKVMFQIIN